MATVCANPVFMATARNEKWDICELAKLKAAGGDKRFGEDAHSFFISVICISADMWHSQRIIERKHDYYEFGRSLEGT
jgi:hypothetical protein